MKHRITQLKRGDSEVALWDPDNKIEIKTAKEVFDRLNLPAVKGGEGCNLYDISKADQEDGLMKAFDPNVEEILAVPQFVGG